MNNYFGNKEGRGGMKKNNQFRLKKLSTFILIGITILMPFLNMPVVKAVPETGKVTSTIYVRSIPGTGPTASKLGKLSYGTIISIEDTVSTSDGSTGCSSGLWYKFSYNGKNGYACTKYVTTSYVDEYDRPWTTPKKSIIGGALYKARWYIAKGQYTSYLVKFNVNPAATNPVYTHQYMTNIRAPWSEAYTSYQAYSKNNLLEQPLVFSIPIYKSMPEYTVLPGGTTDTSGRSEVTDEAFEILLDEQKFPESYKRKLRILHEAYPNWIFESMETNLDWNQSVNAEQPNSYIDGSNVLYRQKDKNGHYILKEGNTWYLANAQTTAYFLDPRNFLKAERILMFEKLAYSSYHTEATVQTILNGTFMEGTSVLDEQTYAEIFVDAASEANVSAIYLSSLAIQEVGVNGSKATTGERFTYSDVTYEGLFNFFNIGAYSSELNPALAGLVWASGGSPTVIIGGEGSIPSTESEFFRQLGLSKKANYITGINTDGTVSAIKDRLSNITLNAIGSNGVALKDDDLIGTGDQISLNDGENTYNGTVVIYGDVNGDGSINAIDLLYVRKYLLSAVSLTGANLEAAKIAKNDSLGAADLLYLRKHLMDSDAYKIVQ